MEPPGSPPLAGFLQHTDLVVQIVVGLLVLGSVASWAIIIAKTVRVVQLSASLRRIEALALDPGSLASTPDELMRALLTARDAELAEEQAPAELRARRAAAMRTAGLAALHASEGGLPFLATLATTAPFLGLFGTVWGIMRSFSAIATASDTSLAVVAPGVAEALFATAIGLGAAIPAVIAYNLVRAALARCGHRLAAATIPLARAPEGPGWPERPQ